MKRTCAVSGQEFEVTEKDLQFYEKMGVPAPTLCPDERQRRRLAWRNEDKLFWRESAGSGKKILSVFHPDVPVSVYEEKDWYSDTWNAKDYAREFDFSRSFFPQLEELIKEVPQLSRSVAANQNCEYVNQCGWSKDCYLIFEADYNDSCLYSWHLFDSRYSVDCLHVMNGELCYECVDCRDCYELRFSQNCKNCHSAWFLKDCIGCSDCFGCVNLRNKQYYFLNQKCSKEEYEQKLNGVDLESSSGLQRMREDFSAFAQQFPHKYMNGVQNEDSTGNYLNQTQRCKHCFDLQQSQDCKYVFESRCMKNVYDTMIFGSKDGAEFCYENHEVGGGVQNICFSDQVWIGCHDIWYSKLCVQNSHNLFGCVGLKHAQYCILNKQYEKEEYFKLREKIVEHMKETGEWGEFFPVTMSPFAYNETVAQEYFPLTKEEVISRGYRWRDEDKKDYKPQTYAVPDRISDVNDDILNEVLACEATGKNYKIQKAELAFYRKMNLPVPRFCPDERHRRRMALRNPRKLYNRKCDQCGKEIETTYSPGRPEKIYCEGCYLESVE